MKEITRSHEGLRGINESYNRATKLLTVNYPRTHVVEKSTKVGRSECNNPINTVI